VAHNTPNPRSCLSAQTADLHLAVRRDTIARCISRPATTMQWRHHRWIDERWLQDVRRIGGKLRTSVCTANGLENPLFLSPHITFSRWGENFAPWPLDTTWQEVRR